VADWTVVLVDVAVETASPLRVGGERGSSDTSDLPVLRDHRGRPYIPGSSLKGVLRSGAERILRGAGLGACDIIASPCGGPPGSAALEDLDALCRVCRLFGSPHLGARLFVGDLAAAGDVPTVVRDGVAIDRNELRVAGNLKYDYEVVSPGARFDGQLRLDDPAPGDVGLVLRLLDLLDAGVLTVGGGASRGLGRLRFPTPPAVRRLVASRWQPGAAPEPVDAGAARTELDELLAAEARP
jgi:CRISPR-associated protein Csm3